MKTFRKLLFASLLLAAVPGAAGALEMISRSPSGRIGSANSFEPAVSANGRYVVWMSNARNLVADIGLCENGYQVNESISLRDTLTNVTELIPDGGFAPGVSTTGRYVAYGCVSLDPYDNDACVLDRDSHTVDDLPAHEVGPERHISISDDGRFLAYIGGVPVYPGYENQVLVYDRCVSDGAPVAGCTPGREVGSASDSGAASDGPLEYPRMTPDGRFVVFNSLNEYLYPTHLVPGASSGEVAYVRDRCVTTSGPVPSCTPSLRAVSADDADFQYHCGQAIVPSISDDGRYVAWDGCGQIYVRDRDLDGNGVFDESGPGMTQTEIASRNTAGDLDNFGAQESSISGNGRYVVFMSGATNLAGPTETDGGYDIYLRDLVAQTTVRVSESPSGTPSHYVPPEVGRGLTSSISQDGHRVVFDSDADNLIEPPPSAAFEQIYRWADCAAAAPTCGDGIPYYGCEECDDGNAVNGDGCDNNCTHTRCGNGIQTAGEGCDDGNTVNGDGCDNNCTPTACGNGIRTGGEECDDGNTTDGDGCSSTCTFELDRVIPGGGGPTNDCWHEWRTDPPSLLDPHGLPRRTLECTDDDPSCDFGAATSDKACTFHVALCINVEDPRLVKDGVQQCATAPIVNLYLKKPNETRPKDATDTAIRDALESKFQELGLCVVGSCSRPAASSGAICGGDSDCDSEPYKGDGVCSGRFATVADPVPITSTNDCTSYMDVVVPLGLKNGVYVKAKRKLGLLVEPIPDPVTDKFPKGDGDKLALTCLPAP